MEKLGDGEMGVLVRVGNDKCVFVSVWDWERI